MLMSIFSSFDALSAEFSFGQRSRLSIDGASLKPKPEQKPSSSVDSTEKKPTSPDSSKAPAPPSTQPGGAKQQRRRFSPRFAPELDGVHCFESIVPY